MALRPSELAGVPYPSTFVSGRSPSTPPHAHLDTGHEHFVDKSWTSGATAPWSAGVAVIESPATTSLGMWFILPPMTRPILRRSWKSQGSLSLGTLLTTTALLIQTRLTPPFPLAYLLTSGSLGAPATIKKHGLRQWCLAPWPCPV